MRLEDLETEWAVDAEIDETRLAAAALDIPKLHSKWYRYMSAEKMNMYKLQIKLDQLVLNLESYFLKTMTEEERVAAGLPEFSDKKILKVDAYKHIDAYPDVIQTKLKIALQSDKIDFVKDILKCIHNRNFMIKSAIDVKKFEAGSY